MEQNLLGARPELSRSGMLAASITTTPSSLRQMQLVGIMQATKSTLCFNNLERKPRVVALFQLHVNSLLWHDHLMLQVPPSAPTELGDDGIAIAEEVNVEGGVRAWLNVDEYS